MGRVKRTVHHAIINHFSKLATQESKLPFLKKLADLLAYLLQLYNIPEFIPGCKPVPRQSAYYCIPLNRTHSILLVACTIQLATSASQSAT